MLSVCACACACITFSKGRGELTQLVCAVSCRSALRTTANSLRGADTWPADLKLGKYTSRRGYGTLSSATMLFSSLFSTFLVFIHLFLIQIKLLVFFIVERPSTILDVDSGSSLLVVPDPFGTLEMSDAPGKFLALRWFFPLFSIYRCKSSL